jgi:hypothetical protein
MTLYFGTCDKNIIILCDFDIIIGNTTKNDNNLN